MWELCWGHGRSGWVVEEETHDDGGGGWRRVAVDLTLLAHWDSHLEGQRHTNALQILFLSTVPVEGSLVAVERFIG